MKKYSFLFIMFLSLVIAPATYAIPTLQLDIKGGTYNTQTETVVAAGTVFTLYGLLYPEGQYQKGSASTLDDTYYLSMALEPNPANPYNGQNYAFGSFTFSYGSTKKTINVTSDMKYGVPPIESSAVLQPFDCGDLSKHSVFPTYFTEFEFKFDPANRADPYNTQDYAGQGPLYNKFGSMYYAPFSVDTTNITAPYIIHFDLYSTAEAKKSGSDIDIKDFAPFSHDAESTPVPEPDTVVLLGIGLLGLVVYGRRKLRNKEA